MKGKVFIVVLAILLVGVARPVLSYCQSGNDGLDSVVKEALDEKLEAYFAAIERAGTDVQKEECDFLIETCTDSLMRQHVALAVYDHYVSSKVMGAEAVAVHVFDKWFDSGKVAMRNSSEMFAARMFAEFNRMSLIGNKAPSLDMLDMDHNPVTLFDKPSGRYTILYFYDSSCSTCKVNTVLLRNLLQQEDYPVDLVAVYAADNKADWQKYVEEQFSIEVSRTRIVHLWDPELDSDFQRKYGVLQTPRLFLISPDGTIVGRGLDVPALVMLLNSAFAEVELEYGSDESMMLYEGLFGDSSPEREDVVGISDYIKASTLEKGDTVMFRQMTGDMLYYLTLQKGEGFKEGLDELIDNKILSSPDVWKSEDDSLKVIGMAQMFDDLLSRSTPGKTIPDMKLPGLMLSKGKEKAGTFRTGRLRGQVNYIMFVTEGCHVCADEKAAARETVLADWKVKVLIVNVDKVLESNPSLAEKMFGSFDLSALPFILQTDRKGRIQRRYISLVK